MTTAELNARYAAASAALEAQRCSPAYLLTLHFAGHTGMLAHERDKHPAEVDELIAVTEAMFTWSRQDGEQLRLTLE